MADDAASLLIALGEPKAHIFGVSMGGMIAQHFALNHADKLNKLVLVPQREAPVASLAMSVDY